MLPVSTPPNAIVFGFGPESVTWSGWGSSGLASILVTTTVVSFGCSGRLAVTDVIPIANFALSEALWPPTARAPRYPTSSTPELRTIAGWATISCGEDVELRRCRPRRRARPPAWCGCMPYADASGACGRSGRRDLALSGGRRAPPMKACSCCRPAVRVASFRRRADRDPDRLAVAGPLGARGRGGWCVRRACLRARLSPTCRCLQTGLPDVSRPGTAGRGWLGAVRPGANSVVGRGLFLSAVVFSGSLYTLALTGQRLLGAITPLGGVAFLAGWGCLAWGALNRP
jgi:hypothetical protein